MSAPSSNGRADKDARITFTVDGREIEAGDGELLIEAAKKGDVEIPYFCYEPKIGPPVGACRMCLVEIEGIPKLQTACSTPVKDGMVVNTVSDQVKQAQESVVEFLLVNHPLDCPVCDKGGECPLQDITVGWGRGCSRTTEPKRHYVKPLQLSPLVAIDRERCILCYRCVRYSQEVSEDNQLAMLGRGANTFVGTYDGSMYVAPFSGNVIELCPVGALTSTAYRFQARPWDVENSGSICTLCPSQCNIQFTIRDEKVKRVLARDNPGVDNGWLCDKGRFGYQSIYSHQRLTEPLVRQAGMLRPVSWEEALDQAAAAMKKAGASSAALVGGETTNEEGFLLQKILRESLGSNSIDSRSCDIAIDLGTVHLLNRPELQAAASDIDAAEAVLVVDVDPVNEMPIVDLRVRKAVRRGKAKLLLATARPGALDAGCFERVAHQPGTAEALLAALTKAVMVYAEQEQELHGHEGIKELKQFYTNHSVESLAAGAGADPHRLRDLARALYDSDATVVIWGEELTRSGNANQALKNLANLALLLRLDQQSGGGLFEVPSGSNGRGLRDVGCLPNVGPGLGKSEPAGLTSSGIAAAAAAGDLDLVYLLHSDPFRDLPNYVQWSEGLKTTVVIAHAQFLSVELERCADVILPAESYAEKQGTVTHPDGRLQRLRSAVSRPGKVRMEWQVLAELGQRLGLEQEPLTPAMVFEQVRDSVGFYSGISLEAITAQGARWQEHESVEQAPAAEFRLFPAAVPPELEPSRDSQLRASSYRQLWASTVTENSPQLGFLTPSQNLQVSPEDAERLGLRHGDKVEVSSDGHSIAVELSLVSGIKPGLAYLIEGTLTSPASIVTSGAPVAIKLDKAGEPV